MNSGICVDIFTNFIGAFFGFLFAIIVEIWVSRKDDRDMQEKVRDNIIKELRAIGHELMAVEQSNPIYFRYKFIAWTTCVNSGYLFSVSGKPIYNQYVDIYAQIMFADDLEQQYFSLIMRKEQGNVADLRNQVLAVMDKNRVEKRKNILEEIRQICNLL